MTRGPVRDWITVGFFTLLSAGIRLVIAAGSSFPINDGGLFYAFISDLLADGLRLPQFSSYNAAGIPFVYPPLAFYLTAVAHLATGVSTLRLLQFVPAIVSAAAIPVFFDLAEKMLQSRRRAVLATAVFSLIPRTFDWLIMGGGITRSLGLLFVLAFLGQIFRLVAEEKQGALVPAILAGGLVVVSHPEATVQAALAATLLLAWRRRTRRGIAQASMLVVGIAVLTTPWWLTILTRHGMGPWLAGFAAAQADGNALLPRLVALLRFDFTDEPFLRIFGVLGLLGFFVQIARRWYLPAAWFTLMGLAEPRGGTLFMMIPIALAAGFFLDSVLLPCLRPQPAVAPGGRRQRLQAGAMQPHGELGSPLQALVLIFLFLYGSVTAYFVGRQLRQNTTLGSRDRMALEWISSHTAPVDRFVLVTEGQPLLDPTSDWFPALTGRRSVASNFGAEWIRDLDFAQGLARYRALQACADQSAECLKEWGRSNAEPVRYVYVRAPDSARPTILQASLQLDQDFRLVFSEQGIEVFEWLAADGN